MDTWFEMPGLLAWGGIDTRQARINSGVGLADE